MCPHCDRARPWRRGARFAAKLLGASTALVTLMACYGMMARPGGMYAGADADGDGVAGNADCDDARADVYPGAPDLDGDGVDQNCDTADGWLDPDAPPPAVRAADPPPGADPAPAPKVIATEPAAGP